jgi:hypothetical protein
LTGRETESEAPYLAAELAVVVWGATPAATLLVLAGVILTRRA